MDDLEENGWFLNDAEGREDEMEREEGRKQGRRKIDG